MEPAERAQLLHQALVEAQEHFDLLVEEMETDYLLNRTVQALKTDLEPARLTAGSLVKKILHPRTFDFGLP